MAEQPNPGIYLVIRFKWPADLTREMTQAARRLHDEIVASDWIEEAVAASGGLGVGPSSLWVLHLQNYAALDRLLKDRHDPLSQAYFAFFDQMVETEESVREGVLFL